MKKIFIVVAVLIVLIAAVGSAAIFWRNPLVKMLLTKGIKEATGVNVMIEEVDVVFVPSTIKLRDVILFNPQGYPERIMADIPEIFIDYDLHAIRRGDLHFRRVKLDLRKIAIIKDKHGRVNVDYLKKSGGGEEAVEAKGKPIEGEKPVVKKDGKTNSNSFRIDRLELKIGKVVYRDYSPDAPVPELELNFYTHDVFKNVTSLAQVVRIVLARAVYKTTIQDLVGIDISPLGEPGIADVFREKIKDVFGDVFDKFGDKIKLPWKTKE